MAADGCGGKVVVGVDGSEGGRRAAARALAEARVRQLPLDVVYVWELPLMAYSAPGVAPPSPSGLLVEGRSLVADELAGLRTEGVEVTPRVVAGSPPSVLREISAEPGLTLLVVGTHGRGVMAELVLGSVSNHLSRHSTAPLVVVPSRRAVGDGSSTVPKIVVGVDGSEWAVRALRWAAEEAHIRRATLEIVAVSCGHGPGWVRVPLNRPDGRGHPPLDVDTLAEISDGIDVEVRCVEGDPAETLLRRSCTAQLLVVGSRGLGWARGLLVGSVSRACVQRSLVPVAVIR